MPEMIYAEALLMAVCQAGIIQAPKYIVAGAISRGELQPILTEFRSPESKPIAIVYPQKKYLSAEAAALPLVSITAWEGLIDRAKVQPGQKVLVYGATGGVGHIGVQLAKWAGATVYALVSSDEKAAIAHRLGADVTINYCHQPVEEFVAEHTNGQGFDVVFNTVGNDNLQNAFKAAKLNGTVVSIVSLSQQDLTLLHAKGLTLHLDLVGIFSVQRSAVAGAETHLYTDKKGEPILSKILCPGEFLVFQDDRYFHFTSPISATTSGQGVRDVFVCTSPGLFPPDEK